MTDADRKVSIRLASMPGAKTTMLSLATQGGTADFKVSPIGTEVDLQDEVGDTLATLKSAKHGTSLTLGYSHTEEEGIMTSNGIGFYDREGKVTYSAGRK